MSFKIVVYYSLVTGLSGVEGDNENKNLRFQEKAMTQVLMYVICTSSLMEISSVKGPTLIYTQNSFNVNYLVNCKKRR